MGVEQIPEVLFRHDGQSQLGFEIMRLSDFYEKAAYVEHPVDIAHRTEFFIVLYITKGSGFHYLDFQQLAFQAGSVVLISAGQVQQFELRAENDGYMMLFTRAFLDKSLSSPFGLSFLLYAKHLGQAVFDPMEKDRDALSLIFRLMEDIYQHETGFRRSDMLQQVFNLFFLKLESLNDARPDRLETIAGPQLFLRFVKLLEAHFREARNAAFYAEQLRISYKHLNQTVKKTVGHSVKHFIDRFVVLEIERQLVATDLPIKSIAYEMGFDEPTNFVKFFRRHQGLSPNRYRTQHAK